MTHWTGAKIHLSFDVLIFHFEWLVVTPHDILSKIWTMLRSRRTIHKGLQHKLRLVLLFLCRGFSFFHVFNWLEPRCFEECASPNFFGTWHPTTMGMKVMPVDAGSDKSYDKESNIQTTWLCPVCFSVVGESSCRTDFWSLLHESCLTFFVIFLNNASTHGKKVGSTKFVWTMSTNSRAIPDMDRHSLFCLNIYFRWCMMRIQYGITGSTPSSYNSNLF